MTSRLNESDLRDGLGWFRAVLTGDDDGARCVAGNADPARVLDAVATLALALRIDPLRFAALGESAGGHAPCERTSASSRRSWTSWS